MDQTLCCEKRCDGYAYLHQCADGWLHHQGSRLDAGYFAAVGGAGALLSKCITSSEVIAYDDLGTEAIRKLTVKNLPVIVVIDSYGNNLYETAIEQYKES